MHACKKSEHSHFLLVVIIILLANSLLFPGSAQTAIPGIEINYVNCDLNEGFYMLDAGMRVELSEESKKALVHGIPLRIDIEIKVIEKRKWLWDKTLLSRMIVFRLSYQPLTSYYIVTNISNGRRQQFSNLDDVLNYLGEIRDYKLVEFEQIPQDNHYTGLFRAKLNIQSLPTPLRPLAYISSQWHLSSPWYEWKFE